MLVQVGVSFRWCTPVQVLQRGIAMTNKYFALDAYSIVLKVSCGLAVFAGLVFEGLMVYGWGQFSVLYSAVKVVFDANVALMSNGSPPLITLPPLPLWPILLAVLAVIVITFYAAATLWAIASWIDLQMTLAKEGREARAMETDALLAMHENLASVARYFASLPAPRK